MDTKKDLGLAALDTKKDLRRADLDTTVGEIKPRSKLKKLPIFGKKKSSFGPFLGHNSVNIGTKTTSRKLENKRSKVSHNHP